MKTRNWKGILNISLSIAGLLIVITYMTLSHTDKVEYSKKLHNEVAQLKKQDADLKHLSSTIKKEEENLEKMKEESEEFFKNNLQLGDVNISSEGVTLTDADKNKSILAIKNIANKTGVRVQIGLPESVTENGDSDSGEETDEEVESPASTDKESNEEDSIELDGDFEEVEGEVEELEEPQLTNPNDFGVYGEPFKGYETKSLDKEGDDNLVLERNHIDIFENVPKGHYVLDVRGEYRSIMAFMYRLRTLDTPAYVSEFRLDKPDPYTEGFPLRAVLKVSLKKQKEGL